MGNKVYVVTNPMPETNKSSAITLNKFSTVLLEVYEKVVIFGGNLHDLLDNENLKSQSVNYFRNGNILKKFFSFFKMQVRLFLKIVSEVKKDDIVFFWIGDKMILPYFAAKLKKANIHYFLMGNVGTEGKKSFFSQLSERLIIYMVKHANYICIESPSVIKYWDLGKQRNNIKIIHLYVGTDVNSLYTEKKQIVGMVCRLTEGKHVLESIMAFNEFVKLNPNWNLQIVGSGKLYNKCKNLIESHGLKDKIELMGWIEHSKLPQIIKKWKLLLFPTDAEGLPNSLIESMLLGVPAIASPVGGIIDVIDHGKNGWILDGTSERNILDAMNMALANERYEELSKNAVKTIVKRYSFEACVANLKNQMQVEGE